MLYICLNRYPIDDADTIDYDLLLSSVPSSIYSKKKLAPKPALF